MTACQRDSLLFDTKNVDEQVIGCSKSDQSLHSVGEAVKPRLFPIATVYEHILLGRKPTEATTRRSETPVQISETQFLLAGDFTDRSYRSP